MLKIQLEQIHPDSNSSFRLLTNPQLADLFYWHFHPEYELVFIEGTDGRRHVGSHISRYEKSDLVLIGTNIPHLNFDYGVKTNYEKVVLQIHPDFKEKIFTHVPELSGIVDLFELAQHGIAYHGKTKEIIGQRLKSFHQLSSFEQFLEALQIFQILAESTEITLLHDEPVNNQQNPKQHERLQKIYAYIDQHYHQNIKVDQVAEMCNLTKAAFCRFFKKSTGSTFVFFLNQYRIAQAKRLLLMGKNISETCYECGFGSLSYFNRIFKRITGENPSEFQLRMR